MISYIERLINVALNRYIYRDQPVPVDLEARIAAEGIDTQSLYYY